LFSRKPLANKFDGEKDNCSLDESDGFSSIGAFNKQNNNVNFFSKDLKCNEI